MTDRDRKTSKADADSDRMHGRSFADTQFASDENQQTRDIERIVRNPPDQQSDDADEVSDAEIEARKSNR